MPLNSFTTFLDDCQIADSESQFIKRSDCDTIFIVCNFQPDKKSAEAQVRAPGMPRLIVVVEWSEPAAASPLVSPLSAPVP